MGVATAIRTLTILSALLSLAGCILAPLPAETEVTGYDSLPAIQPGAITAEELESRYGLPDLRCAEDTLWVYGWSVGHGAFFGMVGGMGGGSTRLYHSYHIVLLWLDAERRLLRLETPQPVRSKGEDAAGRRCASDGTCIRPQWSPWHAPSDTSWACGMYGHCDAYGLTADSVVESAGQVLKCTWTIGEPSPPRKSLDEASR